MSALAVAAWAVLMSGRLTAQTAWTGQASTNWLDAANWTAGVPGTNLDVIVGDAHFTGAYAPTLPSTGVGTCRSLALGTGTLPVSLAVNNTLTVLRDLTIGPNGTLSHGVSSTAKPILVSGNWTNLGVYVAPNLNAGVTFAGKTQQLAGVTSFQRLTINNGSVLSLVSDVAVRSQLTLAGTLDPAESPTRIVSGSGKLTVNSTGILMVRAPTFTGNYSLTNTITLSAGSTVEYGSTTRNQAVSSQLTYSSLKISGDTLKSLTNNLPALLGTAASYGRITVTGGTLDLGPFTANRATNVAGGTLTLGANTRLRLTGASNFPNLNTATLNAASTVEYAGADQLVSARTYGHLLLAANAGAAVKTLPGTALTLYGDLTASAGSGATLAFTTTAPLSVRGSVTLGPGTTFHGGSVTNTLSKNWTNHGAFLGETGTMIFNGANAVITGAGLHQFNHLSPGNTGITVGADTTLTLTGSLRLSNSYPFTQLPGGSGSMIFTGTAATITGNKIAFARLQIPGSITTASSLNVAGDFDVTGSFTATAGTLTLSGSPAALTGDGTLSFYALNIPGTLTVNASFSVRSTFSVTGSLAANTGGVTFAGSTVFSGVGRFHDVILNGTLLRLGAGSLLRISGALTLTAGVFDASRYKPNTVIFDGTGPQLVPATTYHHLQIAGLGPKAQGGNLTVNGDLSIAPGATFVAEGGGFTNSIVGRWSNLGEFVPGEGTVEFTGTTDSFLEGATAFNLLRARKSTVGALVVLTTNITAAILDAAQGTIQTGTNRLTLTRGRTGLGTVIGTLTHLHGFTTNVPYAFESAYTTVTFPSPTTITSLTMTVTLDAAQGFPFGGGIGRHYQVSVSPDDASEVSLRLHYLDNELGGQSETELQLWHDENPWRPQGQSSGHSAQNWVEQTAVTNLAGTWTLSDNQSVVAWTGAASPDWSDPANWEVIEGSAARPPASGDGVQLGGRPAPYQPLISSDVTVRTITFASLQAITLTLAPGGKLTVLRNVSGDWSTDAVHTIHGADQSLTVGGSLHLGNGSPGRAIQALFDAGSLIVTNTLSLGPGVRLAFTGAGWLTLGGDFLPDGGTFEAGTATVIYQGASAQSVAGDTTYHHLAFQKDSGTATLRQPVTVTGDLTLAAQSIVALQTNLTVIGNLRLEPGTTLNGGPATLAFAGDWGGSGSFVPEAGEVILNGPGSQSIAGNSFFRLALDKASGTATLTGNLLLTGDLDIRRGTLDLGGYTADRDAPGATLRLGSGATLRTASHFPVNFRVYELDPDSLVVYAGSIPQDIVPLDYGQLVLSGDGTQPKNLIGPTVIRGQLTIGPGGILDPADQTLALYGDWTNLGTVLPGSSTVTLAGTGRRVTGNTTFNNLDVPGSYTVADCDITIRGNMAVTGSYAAGSGATLIDGDLTSSGTLLSTGTTTFSGTRIQTIRLINAIQSTSYGVVNFEGTVPPQLDSTTPPRFANLNIRNTGGISPSEPWTVYGAFTIGAGASFNGGDLTHTFRGNVTNLGAFTSSGALVFRPLAPCTLSFGPGFSTTGQVSFEGAQAITLDVRPLAFATVTLANTHPGGLTAVSDWTVNGDLVIGAGATFHAGAGLVHRLGANCSNAGTLDGQTSTFRFLQSTLLDGTGSTTFHHVEVRPGASLLALQDFAVSGDFIHDGTFLAPSARVTFSGVSPATVLGSNPLLPLRALILNKPASRLTLSLNLDISSALTLAAGTLDLGAYQIVNAGAATLTVSDGATLSIGGNSPLPSFGSHRFTADSTVEYAGTGMQGIAAQNYGNLVCRSAGHRVLPAAGTVGIAGTFVPGSNPYTITGSTVDYNGSGPQTISAFSYHHLVSSSAGHRTLPDSGTVSIAGSFTPGSNTYTASGSTVLFNGPEQALPAFAFHNLTTAGNGTKTLTGPASVAGTLTLNAPLANGGHTLSAAGDTVNLTSFSGTGGLRLTGGNRPHALLGSGSYGILELADALGAQLATNDLTVQGQLILNSGHLTTGTNRVVITRDATVIRIAGQVDGALQKHVALGSPTVTFEIGDSTAYAPVAVDFENVTTAGELTTATLAGDPPGLAASGLDPSHSLNRHWILASPGMVFGACQTAFEFNPLELDPETDPTTFAAARLADAWTQWAPSDAFTNRIVLGPMDGFGLFAFGGVATNDGVWTNPAGGQWVAARNWAANAIANGVNSLADFGTLPLASNLVVTLDGDRTIGHLRFGDVLDARDSSLLTGSRGVLTLRSSAAPASITVDNRHTLLQAMLAGTSDLVVQGGGTLSLAGDNPFNGGITVRTGLRLNLAHDHALGTTQGVTTVESGATLALAGNNLSIAEDLVLSGDGAAGTGALSTGTDYHPRFSGTITIARPDTRLVVASQATTLRLAGALQLDEDVLIGSATTNEGVVELEGIVTGPGGLRNSADPGNGTHLRLFQANTFTGPTAVRKGVLTLKHPLALQFSTLDWSSAASGSPNGVLDFEALGGVTLGGLQGDRALVLPAGLVLTVGNNDTSTRFSGGLAGSGSRLVKTGNGALTLAGPSSYSGGTVIRRGPAVADIGTPGLAAIVVAHPKGLGTGPVALTPETDHLRALEFDLANAATISNPLELPGASATLVGLQGHGSASDFNLAGPISGGHPALSLHIDFGPDPGGVIRLSNPANTFAATVHLRGGMLAVTSDSALGHPSNPLVLEPAAPTLSGLRFDADAVDLAHDLELRSDTSLDVNGHDVSLTGTWRGDGAVDGNLRGGRLSGGSSVGSLRLAGNNTTLARLRLQSRHLKLIVASPAALGDAAQGTFIDAEDNATVAFANVGQYLAPEPLAIRGQGVLAGGVPVGALENLAGDNAFAGPITLTGDASIGITAGALKLAGAITGGHTLSKTGPGTLTLLGTNTPAAVLIQAGTLQVGDDTTPGRVLADITNLATLVFRTTAPATFDHRLSGEGKLVKSGTGRLALTASNPCRGPTVVAAGILDLAAADGAALSSDTLTVTNAAVLTFSADHQVDHAVAFVLGGGRVQPAGRSSAAGQLTLTEDSAIEFTPGSPSSLEFAASDRISWTRDRRCSQCHNGNTPPAPRSAPNHFRLFVTNWSSADTLRFGTNGAGLGAGGPEFVQVQFVNYDNTGLTTNGYLRPDGVVVPTTRVNHAARFVLQVQPSTTATAGTALAQPPVLALLDEFGNADASDNSTLVSVVSSSGLTGTRTVQVTNGLAVFTDLALTTTKTHRLVFTTGLFPAVASDPISVGPGPAARLIFSPQPAQGIAGIPFRTAPVVRTLDAFDNPTTNLPTSLTVSVRLAAGAGTLCGTLDLDLGTAAGNGIAAFNDLSLDTAGTDKQLEASAPGLSAATSSVFTVAPPNTAPVLEPWAGASLTGIKSFGRPTVEGTYLNGGVLLASDGLLYGAAFTGGAHSRGVLFRLNRDGSDYTVLHAFNGSDGQNPMASLAEGSDGALYGTTFSGGNQNGGVIFRFDRASGTLSALHHFQAAPDGEHPVAALLRLSDGRLAGTTSAGGAHQAGTVYVIDPDGTDFAVLWAFGDTASDGRNPRAALVQGSDGVLHGTTELGGVHGFGTVFCVNDNGSDYRRLVDFGGGSDGEYPRGGLLQATDGRLYGTTTAGGASGFGTVFALTPDGATRLRLHDLTDVDCIHPYASLIQGLDGMLYGTTYGASATMRGSVFRLATNGTAFAIIHQFAGEAVSSAAALVQAPDGTLFGTTYYGGTDGLGSLFTLQPDGTGFGELHSLALAGGGEAWSPEGALVPASSGVLYGTTWGGGDEDAGTVFQLEPNGTGYRVLHSLSPGLGEGSTPNASVLVGLDGRLYATTLAGGANGAGTVFRLDPDGSNPTVLHHFGSGSTDGLRIYSGLIQGLDAVLYGTTDSGGAYGAGTLFALSPDGTGYRILHSFGQRLSDGVNPGAALLLASDGRLYGSTTYGGEHQSGVVFTLATNGTGFAILHNFGDSGDGAYPNAALIQATDGRLYSTTVSGGSLNGGTVFGLNPDGTGYAAVHDFAEAELGMTPYSALVQGIDGALYGTTYYGGRNDWGAVFRLNPEDGNYQLLHDFGSAAQGGANSYAGLMQAADGSFFGATEAGGAYALGSAFRLQPLSTLTVDELSTLNLTLNASDEDLPPQKLTLELLSGPDGMLLDPTTGLLSWTPREDQAAATHDVVVRVTDDGTPPLSATNTYNVTVNKVRHPVTLTASSEPNPARVGESVTVRVGLEKVAGGGAPGGSVELWEGASLLGTGIVENLEAIVSLAPLPASTHVLTAEYSGDGAFLGSTTTVSQVVVRADQTPLVFEPPSPQIYGTTNLLAATGGSGSGALTYRVLSGPGLIIGDDGLLVVVGYGTITLAATKAADTDFAAAEALATVVAIPAETTLTLSSSPNPSIAGQATTLSATLASTGGAPLGSVLFLSGTAPLGTAPIDPDHVASLNLATLPVGQHELRAIFPGNSDVRGSTGTLTHVVGLVPTAVSLAGANPAAAVGQRILWTATVDSSGGIPDGTLSFLTNGTVAVRLLLDPSGQAVFATDALPVGTHTLTAVYAGEGHFAEAIQSATQTIYEVVPASGPLAGGNPVTLRHGGLLGSAADITGAWFGTQPASIEAQGPDWTRFTAPFGAESGPVDLVVQSDSLGRISFSQAYDFHPGGVIFDNIAGQGTGVAPDTGPATGGFLVRISGVNLGNGSDITNVTLCGVPAAIVRQSDFDVVVAAGATTRPGPGEIRIDSISFGSTTKAGAFTYLQLEQSIDFPELPDQVATNTLRLAATASSGLPVVFRVQEGPARLDAGDLLGFTGAGTVLLVASQAGTDTWRPAPDVTNVFDVTLAGATILLHPLRQVYDGTPRAVMATTTPGGLPVDILYNGAPDAPVATGTHAVEARISHPLFEGTLTAELVIEPAPTSLLAETSPNPSAHDQPITLAAVVVSPLANDPVPTGSMILCNGSDQLAALPLDPTGRTSFRLDPLNPGAHTLTLAYAGDANFAASTLSLHHLVSPPPVLEAISNQLAWVLLPFSVTNRLAHPERTLVPLRFELIASPTGMRIHPTLGIVRWTPSRDQARSTNRVAVRVTDSRTPFLTETNSFSIEVGDFAELSFMEGAVEAGRPGSLGLGLTASTPLTNLQAILRLPEGEFNDLALTDWAPGVVDASVELLSPGTWRLAFAADASLPLISLAELARLSFTSHRSTPAFVPVQAADLEARRPDGSALDRVFALPGRVVIVGSVPLLDAAMAADREPGVTVFALPDYTYELLAATNLLTPGSWRVIWQGAGSTNVPRDVLLPMTGNGSIFYRTRELLGP